MKLDDRPHLPCLQPKILGNQAIVLIDLAVTVTPVEKCAGHDGEPAIAWRRSRFFPTSAKRNPRSGLAPPPASKCRSEFLKNFFGATCSVISSAGNHPWFGSSFHRYSMRSCAAWWLGSGLLLEAVTVLKLLLPPVEHRRMQSELVVQVRNRNLLQ
jgi:hypothetical protein